MKAIEININGQKSIVAASDNLTFLNVTSGHSDEIILRGSDDLHYYTWFANTLKIGDKVSIRIVETVEISPVVSIIDRDKDEIRRIYEHLRSKLKEKGLI